MKKIICEDTASRKIEFAYDGEPLRLVDTDGFAAANYTVNTSQNSGQDGETYNGATAQKRNPVITAELSADYVNQRERLYSFFQPRTNGTVYYYDNDSAKKANYYVEKIDIGETGVIRTVVISLICPDPKFYALDDEISFLAMWQSNIRFPIKFTNPFKVTTKINTLIGNVFNGSNVTQSLTIKFMATGTVVNPSLYDVNRHNKMQINTTMHSGDVVTITTGTDNKRITMTSGGVTTNINNLMAYPPVWLQAYQGDNLFRYDATSGIDSLNVSILHTQAYWGA